MPEQTENNKEAITSVSEELMAKSTGRQWFAILLPSAAALVVIALFSLFYFGVFPTGGSSQGGSVLSSDGQLQASLEKLVEALPGTTIDVNEDPGDVVAEDPTQGGLDGIVGSTQEEIANWIENHPGESVPGTSGGSPGGSAGGAQQRRVWVIDTPGHNTTVHHAAVTINVWHDFVSHVEFKCYDGTIIPSYLNPNTSGPEFDQFVMQHGGGWTYYTVIDQNGWWEYGVVVTPAWDETVWVPEVGHWEYH